MLTKVEVYTPRASDPPLVLNQTVTLADTIIVRNIDGLGPVKATVNTTPFGSADGESFNGSNVGKRNIVLTLALNPNWATQSMASLRQLLYAYFMPKAKVRLRFFRDTMSMVEIVGYVEGFEPNIFSKDPEVQISIICPMPDFVDVSATVVSGLVGNGSVETAVNYVGTVSTGFVVAIKTSVAKPLYGGPFSVVNKTPFAQVFAFIGQADTTKYLELSSVRGMKYLRNIAITNGAITNLLSSAAADYVWPRLEPGVNTFSVIALEPGQLWTLTYFNRFGGM